MSCVFRQLSGCIFSGASRQNFCSRKEPTPGSGSAHAAVGSPVHLGHLASDDISLETPAANPRRCAFSHDDVMTRWQRDLEATVAIRREGLHGGIAGFNRELHV